MIDREILECFIEEAIEQLDAWESLCLELDDNGYSQKVADDLFRIAHNLKGTSKACGLDEFGHFIHDVEDVINALKRNPESFSDNVVRYFLDVHRVLNEWTIKIGEDPDFKMPQNELDLVLKRGFSVFEKDSSESVVSRSERHEEQPQPQIEDIVIDEEPELPEISQESVVPEAPIAEATPQEETAQNEVLTAGQLDEAERIARQKKIVFSESVRVKAEKIEKLLMSVGELTIQKSILDFSNRNGTLGDKPSVAAIESLSKTITEIQDFSLSLRLQPARSTIQRLARVARDASRDLNKTVRVETSGEEIEMDKIILDRIIEPLTHIVRNAIDHGLEKPEEREAIGKSSTGLLEVQAIQNSSSVRIYIRDDGKGLDSARILEKAIGRGLVDRTNALTEKQIHQLIFHPQLSTKEEVTKYSGRGVGMDIVRDALNELGGQISIQSEQGKGTEFQIDIPTSLSLIDSIVLKLGNANYAVPQAEILEILDVEEYDITIRKSGRSFVDLRGEVAEVAKLSDFYPRSMRPTINVNKESGTGSMRYGLIVEKNNRKYVLLFDHVINVQQVFIRSLSGTNKSVPFYKGSTILADGRPGMVLDLNSIVDKVFNLVG